VIEFLLFDLRDEPTRMAYAVDPLLSATHRANPELGRFSSAPPNDASVWLRGKVEPG